MLPERRPTVAGRTKDSGFPFDRRQLLRGSVGLAGIAALGGLASCSNSSGGTATSTETDLGASTLAKIESHIATSKAVPQFVAPGPAFDASSARGKSVLYISLDQSIPIVQVLWQATKEAAEAAGLRPSVFDGKGQQTLYVAGMGAAIAQKVDVILIESVATATLEMQIKEARAAGIKVISLNELEPIKDIDASVTLDYLGAAQLEADWVIADSKGKDINAVVFLAPFPTHMGMAAKIKEEFDTYVGGNYKLTTKIIGFADWQTRTGPLVRSLLTSDPTINYMIPVVDGQALFMVPAIQQAGKDGSVKVSTFNATQGVLSLMKNGNIVGADSGQDTIFAGWAYIDQALRVLTKNEPVKGSVVPNRMFDKMNVGDIDLSKPESWFDDATAKAGFKKLWSLAG